MATRSFRTLDRAFAQQEQDDRAERGPELDAVDAGGGLAAADVERLGFALQSGRFEAPTGQGRAERHAMILRIGQAEK